MINKGRWSVVSFFTMSLSDLVEIQRLNNNFNTQFHRQRNRRVYCRQCGAGVTVGCFAVHLRDDHALNCETACPFCYKTVQWQKGDIGKDLRVSQHRKKCLQTFLKTHKVAPRLVPPSIQKLDEEARVRVPPPYSGEIRMYTAPIPDAYEFCPTCYAHNKHGAVREMDGRIRHSEWGDSFYAPFPDDPLFSGDRGPNHVRFSEESGLGLCAYNMFQCFLSGEYAFYHLMVRARLWLNFYHCDWPCVHFLPYSCLCDGRHASEEEDDRVHHRHMIVVMRRCVVPCFKKLWKSVVFRTPLPPVDAGGPVRRQRNKLCIAIDDASHLLYALAYVSRPRATCDGYGNDGSGSHYWIFRELSPCAKLAMATLWEQGHATLVSRRHRDSDLSGYYYHVERLENAWQVQLMHLGLREHKCVLPFARGYELCDAWAEDRPTVYVYGRAKFLKCVPELCHLSHNEWLRHQIRTGNCFWECVGHEYYALEHHQIRCMNVTNKVLEGVRNSFDREEIRLMSKMSQLQREAVSYSEETAQVLVDLGTSRNDLRTAQSELRSTQSVLSTTQIELRSTQRELREYQRRFQEFEKREQQGQVRIRQLETEVRRVRDKCMAQLEESNREYRERLRVSEETIREYRDKIRRLDDELKGVHEASSQDRVEQLERALQVMTKWYAELRKTSLPPE